MIAFREKQCADAIEPYLIHLGRPDEHSREWHVCVGSHGGSGKTLLKAMRACCMCCGLGEWWVTERGDGPPLRDVFESAAKEHLGRSLYAHKSA
jgi:hypothetical protein